MQDRRTFLTTLGASIGTATLGMGSLPRLAGALSSHPARLDYIGVQLYTVRGEMKKDIAATLARVAKIGYREVEFAGYFGKTAAEIKGMLRDNGLTAPSSHLQSGILDAKWDATLDDAQTIGHEYIIVAWLDAKQRATVDDLKRTAERFNKAGESCKARGLKFGYHNHNFEFKPVEGRIPYDVLLAETDPSLVCFQMDLFWISQVGGDPLVYFEKYPGRFPMVHVKDMKNDAKHTMTEVGEGDLDWKRIFARRTQAGIHGYIVEHDEPKAPFESIEKSLKFLKKLDV